MIGDGLYYDIADVPELNETTTIYYGNNDVITYKCLDGYVGPQNCSTPDCRSTCEDGSWNPDPPEILVCVEIDECSSNQCQNNATCVDQINGYLCECAEGFNGTNCDNNIDDCVSHPCQNGGTCEDKIDSYECQCLDGFNGELCENEMTTMVMMTTTENVTATESGLTTVTDDVTITTSDASTTTPDASTAISDGTSHIPTATQATTVSSTTVPAISTSTTALPETTEASSVQSTSPLARETTTTTPTTPKRTEKPHTTPLPCKGECLPTQVCNVRNNRCECRSGYYEDETDSETPCKEPVSIDVILTITKVSGTAANFTEELNNSTSKEFKELESEVCQPFNEIYADDPEFLGCQVLNFSKGSIKVNYVLKFAENTTQNPSTVNQTIQDKLVNSNGSFADEFTIDPDTIVVEPLNECNKELDDCDGNAECIDYDEKGYTCVCNPGYEDSVKSLPGRDCIPRTSTEPLSTESQTNKPETTTEPEEAGLVPWNVIVGVTVPIVGILTITTIGLTCWQYRRQHRTSPSPSKKMNTFPYDEEDKRNSSARPDSMRIINSDGTVQEVVLPWRNFVPEAEFIFGQDSNKRQTQMLPMVDYPNDYSGSTSDENYPMRNIHDAYDNYTYEHHDTRRNTSEIDHVDTGNFF
ncbi:protein crumbs-like isoform X4 [Lytechinus pictus]|uniref:protein crumbs-like isoform X4 n=1 Tax=Lytechinus pictus TaxID=7653 RepID=UPI0030BA008E